METNPNKDDIENWVQGLVMNDIESFNRIYHHFSHKIFGVSRRKFNLSVIDSEEIVQDVFIKLWNSRSKINLEKSFKAYLITICKNTIYNFLRKRSNQLNYVQDLAEDHFTTRNETENQLNYQEMIDKIEQLMSKLSKQRKKVFKMINLEGYNIVEVSKKLSISKRTAEYHLYHANKFIKANLDFLFTPF